MSSLSERVSYLKGLAEGKKLAGSEGEMIVKILELLSDVTAKLESVQEEQDDLSDYVEAIDNDLSDLEDLVYDEDGENPDEDGEDEEEDEDNVVDYTCPHCGEEMTLEVDQFDFDEDYLCPNCHKPLFPETPDEEE